MSETRELLFGLTLLWGGVGWLAMIWTLRSAWRFKRERDQQRQNYQRVLRRLPTVSVLSVATPYIKAVKHG